MSKTIKGQFCRPGLPLSRVLKEWIWLNGEIARRWSEDKDVPWWYNERASLSIFAGAIWNTRNIAFEEFVYEKRRISNRTGRLSGKYRGRIDFYFEMESQAFIAEAKRAWSGGSLLSMGTKVKMSKKLDRACGDIRKVKPYGERRLAIVFVNPYFRKACLRNMDGSIRNWLKSFHEVDCDASAWVFPSLARKLRDDEGYFYPGTALLIKEI